MKILFWYRSGFLLLATRLEEGRFGWPARSDAPVQEATVRELMCVLEGIDLASVNTRKRMQRMPVCGD